MMVSVIIPTYNRAILLREAIESILRQTYKDYEIIVVDDGSTDQTPDVLKEYKDKVRYIRQENKGPGDARNRGLAEADGRYIAFLDSDDIWFDFKLELQVAIMEKLPAIGYLCSDFSIKKESGETIHCGLRTWQKKPRSWEGIYEKNIKYSSLDLPDIAPNGDFNIFCGNIYHALLDDLYVLTSSILVRSECLNTDIKFPEGVFLYEDWEFFARLSCKYDSAYLNTETQFNRGHKDVVRLTHCSAIKTAENRLGLIERVWKADSSFLERYGNEIAAIEGEQLTILSKAHLLESQPGIARKHITNWERLSLSDGRLQVLLFKILAYLPGGHIMLRSVRSLRRVLLGLK